MASSLTPASHILVGDYCSFKLLVVCSISYEEVMVFWTLKTKELSHCSICECAHTKLVHHNMLMDFQLVVRSSILNLLLADILIMEELASVLCAKAHTKLPHIPQFHTTMDWVHFRPRQLFELEKKMNPNF